MPTETPYGQRLLESVRVQCERRGIPPEELESVLAHIGEAFDTPVLEMEAPDLKRVQAQLDGLMRSYLDGRKRRGGPTGAWEVEATRAAILEAAMRGVDLSEVEGTGEEGRVTKADVADAADAEEPQ